MSDGVTRDGAVYVPSAVRTPIGKLGGAFTDVPATGLGGVAIRAAVERAGMPADAWDRVNVNGGAIALGHPIGASGARIAATLVHELRHRGARTGLATLCLGGGGSVAMALERAGP